jgi:hypothetical protein
MTVYHWQIGEAEQEVEDRKRSYLQRWGWSSTCNTPGSYWLWKRDFAESDTQRHARWKNRGPGPLGWPSEPQPMGVITANTDLAVSMTASFLDPETDGPLDDLDETRQSPQESQSD